MLSLNPSDIFGKIVDTINDVVVICDRTSKIIFINSTYEKLFGISREKIIGKKISDIEPEAKLIDVIENGETIHNELVYLRTLNQHILTNVYPIIVNGEIVGGVSLWKKINDAIEVNRLINRLSEDIEKEVVLNDEPFFQEKIKIIGQSAPIKKVIELITKVAPKDINVMVTGQTGTGKELIAKVIHDLSPRRNGNFVEVNCSAIPESLFESELFGYESGSFTGANREGKKGKFELADKGTIFLDEIGELPLHQQAKLLRVLQTKKVDRVGGTRIREVDFRVVAATNVDLYKAVKEGRFREDLYYRLNTFPIHIPPLAERISDLPLLIDHFLSLMDTKDCRYQVAVGAMRYLKKYSWPGNIRQLISVLQYSSVVNSDGIIRKEDLPEYIIREIDEHKLKEPAENLKVALEVVEYDQFLRILNNVEWNKTKAIEKLGISRKYFYKKLKEFGLNQLN